MFTKNRSDYLSPVSEYFTGSLSIKMPDYQNILTFSWLFLILAERDRALSPVFDNA